MNPNNGRASNFQKKASLIKPGTPVMRQRWEDLIFLHWRYDPDVLRRMIPEELEIDTFQGHAYISIVAFRMLGVRPLMAPALPWLSYFNEFNMRLYVRDQRGTPGVYFISLDCDRTPAVWIARTLFSLPYMHAKIDFPAIITGEQSSNQFSFVCQRSSEEAAATYIWGTKESSTPTTHGSLDFFLTERYHFFVKRRGILRIGEVRHEPYMVSIPEVAHWSTSPFIWNGLTPPKVPPHLCHYSQGVDVTALSLVSLTS